MSDSIDITYAVHTATCTFLLDADGFCRRIVATPTSKRREATRNASRCVGAQYVASLDANVTGMLSEMPRVGAAMLFARVDERGRVSLVRTGIVTRFERSRADDPFSAGTSRESTSVQTSAPALSPRKPRIAAASPLAGPSAGRDDPQTQEIQSMDPRDLHLVTDDELDTTSEYESHGTARASHAQPIQSTGPTTLRQPTIVPADEEDDPYATFARKERRSEPVPHHGLGEVGATARVVGLYAHQQASGRRRDR